MLVTIKEGFASASGLTQTQTPQRKPNKIQEDYVFISYQTKDKTIAFEIRKILEEMGIESFLAHEDIDVSHEWENRILEEIEKASIFICLLSQDYLLSSWCLQESGMAVLKKMTIIPFSLDGTIPPGFMRKFQAVKPKSKVISIEDLIPGLIKHNKIYGINTIINLIGSSGGIEKLRPILS